MSDRRRLTVEDADEKVARLMRDYRAARTAPRRRTLGQAVERAQQDLRRLRARERLS